VKSKRAKFDFPMGAMVVLSAAVLAASAWGQPIDQVTINYIEAAAAPADFANEVRAYVTVSTTGQKPITHLTASNFNAIQDGQAVSLKQVARSVDSMAVVLAIDTSGSMLARDKSGHTSMAAARQAAADFIAMLSPTTGWRFSALTGSPGFTPISAPITPPSFQPLKYLKPSPRPILAFTIPPLRPSKSRRKFPGGAKP
jgi:hypothetical protein